MVASAEALARWARSRSSSKSGKKSSSTPVRFMGEAQVVSQKITQINIPTHHTPFPRFYSSCIFLTKLPKVLVVYDEKVK